MRDLIKTSTTLPLALLGLTAGASHLHAADWPTSFHERFFGDWPFEMRTRSLMPAINFVETSKEYIVRAELPGMKKDDISVTLDNGVLTISGERKSVTDDKEASYRLHESRMGVFSRSLSLPRDADPDKVKAEFVDGVLILKIERNEDLKPKQIKIK